MGVYQPVIIITVNSPNGHSLTDNERKQRPKTEVAPPLPSPTTTIFLRIYNMKAAPFLISLAPFLYHFPFL
jgi:hypothetical protein